MAFRATSRRRARWTQLLQQLGKPLDAVVLMEVDYGELDAPHLRPPHLPGLRKVFNVFTSPRRPRASRARRRASRTGSFQRA